MARRILDERNVRKLHKTGGGRAVSLTLPIEVVRNLKWKAKQRVVVRQVGKKVVIEDWKE